MGDISKGGRSKRQATVSRSTSLIKSPMTQTTTQTTTIARIAPSTNNGQCAQTNNNNNMWCQNTFFFQPYDQWKVPYADKKPKKLKKTLNKNIYYPCGYGGGYGPNNCYYNYYNYYYNYYYNCANPFYPALCNYYQQRSERLKAVSENINFVSSDLNRHYKFKKKKSSRRLSDGENFQSNLLKSHAKKKSSEDKNVGSSKSNKKNAKLYKSGDPAMKNKSENKSMVMVNNIDQVYHKLSIKLKAVKDRRSRSAKDAYQIEDKLFKTKKK